MTRQIVSKFQVELPDNKKLTLTLEDQPAIGLTIFLIASGSSIDVKIVEAIYNTSYVGDICEKFETMKNALSLLT